MSKEARKDMENSTMPQNNSKGHLASRAYKAPRSQETDWALIEQYLPLVKSIVARMRIYFPSHVDVQDIYSIALSGLVTAVRKRNPEKTESFSSYAKLRVRGALLDELRRMDWLPRASRTQVKEVRKQIDELEQRLKRPATEEEITQELGISKKEYAHILDLMRPLSIVSMDAPVSQGTGEGMVHDIVPDDTEMNARESCERKEDVVLLRERIKELPDIPQKVLSMYYFDGMRLAEIALVFGLTESRICQIHSQAVNSLRNYLDRASNS